jgi:hypothetical protein
LREQALHVGAMAQLRSVLHHCRRPSRHTEAHRFVNRRATDKGEHHAAHHAVTRADSAHHRDDRRDDALALLRREQVRSPRAERDDDHLAPASIDDRARDPSQLFLIGDHLAGELR